MNELDFIDALSDKSTKRDAAAREFLGKLKTSNVLQKAEAFAKTPMGHQAAAGLAGAVLLGGLGYASMKPGKNGTSSREQRQTSAAVSANEETKRQAKKDKRDLTFREQLSHAITPATKNVADVLAKHPVKGALLLAPQGALAGVGALRLLKSLK